MVSRYVNFHELEAKLKDSAARAERGYMTYPQDVTWLIEEVRRMHKMLEVVLEEHTPLTWTKYGIPVFDAYDSPTATIHGCKCGVEYYPCNTVRIISDTLKP